MTKRYSGPIPFNEAGNLMQYAPSWENPKWVANFDFLDTMHIYEYGRGRSAVTILVRSMTTGQEYGMFVSDFLELVKNATLVKGTVSGKWTFGKKGQNYGLKFVHEV